MSALLQAFAFALVAFCVLFGIMWWLSGRAIRHGYTPSTPRGRSSDDGCSTLAAAVVLSSMDGGE